MNEWESLLEDNPKVLWGLVADVVKAIKAGEGERKTGRRPAVSVGSLDELYELLFPASFSTKPFRYAFLDALGETSQKDFAIAHGINQGTLSRLLNGKVACPSPDTIERISLALNVRPSYFLEYRTARLAQAVTDALMASPETSIVAIRRLAGAPA